MDGPWVGHLEPKKSRPRLWHAIKIRFEARIFLFVTPIQVIFQYVVL